MELKKSHGKIEHAYKHNLKDYKQTIPQLFWYNALSDLLLPKLISGQLDVEHLDIEVGEPVTA